VRNEAPSFDRFGSCVVSGAAGVAHFTRPIPPVWDHVDMRHL
jgi:hypothetical protein